MSDLQARLASLDDESFFRFLHDYAAAVVSLRKAGLSTLEIGDFVVRALARVGR